MKRIRKIGSIFFALMITICGIGAITFQQFQIVVGENHIEESLYKADYEILFQMIDVEQGTLLDEVNSLIESRTWIGASTSNILRTDLVSILVKRVIENQKENKLDHRLSKAELLTILNENSTMIERDFQMRWDDKTKEVILSQMAEDIYQLIDQVPIEVYQIVIDSPKVNILLNENISWIIFLIAGVFIIGIWLLNLNRNFFLYLMISIGLIEFYLFIFTQFFQFAVASATTSQLEFVVDLLRPYMDEMLKWTEHVEWIVFIIIIGVGIIYLVCTLWPRKNEISVGEEKKE